MTIAMRHVVKFPANVRGTKGIDVVRANGTYTFKLNYQLLTLSPSVDSTALVAYMDPFSGQMGVTSLSSALNSNANIQAIAESSTEADKLGYWSGENTYSLTAFTDFARTILAGASQSDVRTTLGLVPGTDVQAHSANLDDFSSKAAPTGDVVGTSDTQTLTGKTIDGDDNTFANVPVASIDGLATVATSGSYDDLSDTPTLGTAAAADTTDFATAAQGAKADSAVQPGDLGSAASEDVGTSAGNVVQLDGSGKLPAVDGSQLTGLPGGGDMLAATYDPNNVSSDAFDSANTKFLQSGTGAVARTVAARLMDNVNVKNFGAKGDGVFNTTGAVSGAGKTTFTSANVSFTSADIGKLIKIASVGTAGGTHITTIASINSATSCELTTAAASTGSSKNFTYGTNDLVAIKAARDWCWSQSRRPTLNFPDGRYCYDGDLEFAKANWTVNMLGGQVWFESFRTTSGNALSLNGSASNPSGTYGFHFGGAYPANIRGNTNCTNGLYFNGLVQSSIRARSRDSAVGILADNAGSTPLVAAVSCYLDLGVPKDDISFFDFTPSVGLYLAYVYASWGTLIAESCGTSSTTPAIRLTASNGNVFQGGTAQSNNYGGVLVTSTASRNTFIGMHNEFNGQGPDWQIDGDCNVLIGCAGAGTYASLSDPANQLNGSSNIIQGGDFEDLKIDSGAVNCVVTGADLSNGTVTNSSPTSTIKSCKGYTSTWTAYTPASFVSSGGILTTTTGISGRYKMLDGKTCAFVAHGTITTNGTGVTSLRISLPFAAKNDRMIVYGQEETTGKALIGYTTAASATLIFTLYDGTYPGGDGKTIHVTGTYEIN